MSGPARGGCRCGRRCARIATPADSRREGIGRTLSRLKPDVDLALLDDLTCGILTKQEVFARAEDVTALVRALETRAREVGETIKRLGKLKPMPCALFQGPL